MVSAGPVKFMPDQVYSRVKFTPGIKVYAMAQKFTCRCMYDFACHGIQVHMPRHDFHMPRHTRSCDKAYIYKFVCQGIQVHVPGHESLGPGFIPGVSVCSTQRDTRSLS